MEKVVVSLKIFFEDPFWVGIIERLYETELTVAKVTFGPEPKDYEVYSFFLENYYNLKFSNPVAGVSIEEKRKNPKRVQRDVKKQLSNVGIGTKSQQALKSQYEENKSERKKIDVKRRQKI